MPEVRPKRGMQRCRPAGHARFALALAWGVLGVAGLVMAQAPPAATSPAPAEAEEISALSTSDVQADMTALEAATDLPPEQKDAILALYRQALEELRLADDWNNKAARFRQTRESAPADLEAAKAQLAAPAPKPIVPPPESLSGLDFDTLKQRQADAESAAAKAQAERDDLDARIRRRSERREEIAVLDADAKAKLDEIDARLAEPVQVDPLQQAQRTLLKARRQRALAQRVSFAEELRNYEATRDLIRTQLDLAARKAHQAQETADQWKQLRAQFEKSQANLEAINAQRSVITARPEVEPLARRNKSLAEERKSEQSPAAQLDDIDEAAREATEQQEKLAAQFEHVKSLADLGDGSGTLLLRYREQLPDPRMLRQDILARDKELQRIKLRLLELKTRRSNLEDIDRAAEKFVDSLSPPLAEPARTEVLHEVTQLLETQREYIDALIADYEKYSTALARQLDPAQRDLLRTVTEYSEYINEHILWVRSVPPWGSDDVRGSWTALLWLVDPNHWHDVGATLLDDVRESPLFYVLAVGVGGVLFFSQRRLRRRVRAASEMASQSYTTSVWPTFDVLLLTALIALIWPLTLWFVAWRLSVPWDADTFSQNVSRAMMITALVLLMMELLRQVCRKKGLADVHFAWPEDSIRVLRRNLRWLILGIVPLTFVVAVFSAGGYVAYEASLGRLAFMISMILLTIFARRVIKGVHLLIDEHFSAGGRIAWIDGTRFLWYPLVIGTPLVLAILAALGFYFTAQLLAWRVHATIWFAFALLVIHSLALRMLLVARRNVAIRQARERRAQLAKASESNELAGNDVPMVGETQQIDLSSINLQIRRLLNAGLLVALVIGSWLIWIGVLPALRIFDQWTLWTYDGGNVTAIDLFMSVTYVLLTIVASRNLPGLLEITWLQRLPLDAGARYAVTSLARYCVTLIGFVAAFQRIGITWSSVQWLAAAVTVGLGFGLQEIFANFVSGLIILFERPMRVGDIVTVADVSGIVTRIRTRATTITNWDHKELIIPNKEFITGQLINWTLADTVLRIVIKVGVAYGSDLEQTTKLLFKIAKDQPNVLDDPAPQIVFTNFGDSTLDFEMRVFLPSPSVMVPTQHELNMAIDREFRAANIEIAFPQRDLHVRSIDDAILDRVVPLTKGADRS